MFLAVGAFAAVVGGITIGVLRYLDPAMNVLRPFTHAYESVMLGFVLFAVLSAAWALVEITGRSGSTLPEPAPIPSPAPVLEMKSTLPTPADLSSTFKQMKTFIDLEMWELALEKANDILQRFPDSHEAGIVGRHMSDLRWKAEPKFLAQPPGTMSADQEKALRTKGLALMFQHVKTYMELDMWELAREKAVVIMKNFPDSREASELVALYPTIERKCAEVPKEPVPIEDAPKE